MYFLDNHTHTNITLTFFLPPTPTLHPTPLPPFFKNSLFTKITWGEGRADGQTAADLSYVSLQATILNMTASFITRAEVNAQFTSTSATLNAEISARAAADAVLTNTLNLEIARATTAEGNLMSNLNAANITAATMALVLTQASTIDAKINTAIIQQTLAFGAVLNTYNATLNLALAVSANVLANFNATFTTIIANVNANLLSTVNSTMANFNAAVATFDG